MRFVKRPDIKASNLDRHSEVFGELQRYLSLDSAERDRRRPPQLDHKYLKQFLPHLRSMFEGRCAYCETVVEEAGNIGVDQFRPQQNAENSSGKSSLVHYTWLAYSWENLIYACAICTAAKSNKFPIIGKRGKINASVDELRKIEQSLLIDPCDEISSPHLYFDANGMVHARDNSEKGNTTIDLLELNRPSLLKKREAAFKKTLKNLQQGNWRFFKAINTDWDIYKTRSKSNKRYDDQEVLVLDSATPFPGATTKMLVELFRSAADFEGDIQSLINQQRSSPKELNFAINNTVRAYREVIEPKFIQDWPSIKSEPTFRKPVTDVSIRNFKGIKNLEFSFNSSPANKTAACMMILGENATGKSTVLEAIALATIGVDHARELAKNLPKNEIDPWHLLYRPDIAKWDHPTDEPIIVSAMCGQDLEFGFKGSGGAEFLDGTEKRSKLIIAYGARRYFSKKKRRFKAPEQRLRSLFDPHSVIADPNTWFKSKDFVEHYPAVARALRPILMLSNDEDDIIMENNSLSIITDGLKTPFNKMSVGYKSVITMAIDIMRELLQYFDNLEEASAVVLIDELETHLHPRWKMQIMTALRKSMPKVQFIATTHDPLCLQGMKDNEVFVLRRNQNNYDIECVPDLPSLKGMQADQILTSEFFGLGSTDPTTDALLIRFHILSEKMEELTEPERSELEDIKLKLQTDFVVGKGATGTAHMQALKAHNSKTVVPMKAKNNDKKKIAAMFLEELKTSYPND